MTEDVKEKLRAYHLDSAVHYSTMGATKRSVHETILSVTAYQGSEQDYFRMAKLYKIETPKWLLKK